MLDEPHARLNTYMNLIGGKLSVHASSTIKDATLDIQALGINPFSTTEPITEEYNSDHSNLIIGSYNETAATTY
jgi:hypothetical protein